MQLVAAFNAWVSRRILRLVFPWLGALDHGAACRSVVPGHAPRLVAVGVHPQVAAAATCKRVELTASLEGCQDGPESLLFLSVGMIPTKYLNQFSVIFGLTQKGQELLSGQRVRFARGVAVDGWSGGGHGLRLSGDSGLLPG